MISSNGRTITFTNPTEETSGTYKVIAALYGCQAEATTDLVVSLCDNFYVEARNPLNGELTTKMPRRPNTTNVYDPMVLTVRDFNGSKPLYLNNVTWSSTTTSPTIGQDPLTVKAVTMGKYTANLGAGCLVSVDLSAQPCTVLEDAFKNCGQEPTAPIADNNTLTALAPGDYFNAGDYEVRVLTITATTGTANTTRWTGTGYTNFSVGGLAQTTFEVDFTNISINQCYQLKANNTGTVRAAYDPTWGNFLQPKELFCEAFGMVTDLDNFEEKFIQLSENYSGNSSELSDLEELNSKIKTLKVIILCTEDYEATVKN